MFYRKKACSIKLQSPCNAPFMVFPNTAVDHKLEHGAVAQSAMDLLWKDMLEGVQISLLATHDAPLSLSEYYKLLFTPLLRHPSLLISYQSMGRGEDNPPKRYITNSACKM